MLRPVRLSVVLLSVSLACASPEPQTPAAPAMSAVPEEFALTDVDSQVNPTGAEAEAPAEERAARDDGGLSPLELSIWNSPDFKRRFTESYIADTDVEPRVTVLERDAMQEVLELISNDQLDEAQVLLLEERNETSSAVLEFTLANIFFQRDQLEEAATEYAAAVAKHPKFRRAWQNLALVRVRLGEFEPAAEALTRVLELGGGDAITYGLLGISRSNMEDEISAETSYRMAMLLDPATPDWKMYLARSLFRQARFADAVALTDSLIQAEPDRADLWLLQANAYIGQGEVMKAAENYELVDRLGGSTADSLRNLGDIYINEELFDLAVDAYVRALENDPEGELARPMRAASQLTAHGALPEAKRLIAQMQDSRAESLGDERITLLRLQARIAVAEGEGGEEARVLEEIVQLDPLDGEALLLLGQHASREGDDVKAGFYYERAASLEDFEADAKVRHAQLLVGQGRYTEALPMLRRAQTLKPRDNIQEYLEQVERVAQSR